MTLDESVVSSSSRSMRRLTTALLIAAFVCVAPAGAREAVSFDSITYRDSGGFAGGTGKSLAVTADGRLDAQTREGPRPTLQLQPRELADLNAAVAAVDWPQVAPTYHVAGGHDIPRRDLIVKIGGNTYETHADVLAKIPASLQQLFNRLDALYARAVGPVKR